MHLLGRKPVGHEDDPAMAVNTAVESDDDDDRADEDEVVSFNWCQEPCRGHPLQDVQDEHTNFR